MPEIETEVWLLKTDFPARYQKGGYLLASKESENEAPIVFLAMLNEADALKVAAFQKQNYGVICYPVRVK